MPRKLLPHKRGRDDISDEISYLVREKGYNQKQAVAAALTQARQGRLGQEARAAARRYHPPEGVSTAPALRLEGRAARVLAEATGRELKRDSPETPPYIYTTENAIAAVLLKLAEQGKGGKFSTLCNAAPEGACRAASRRLQGFVKDRETGRWRRPKRQR